MNGAAAHKAKPGDKVIICTYSAMDAGEAKRFQPTLVYLDEDNAITHTSHDRLAAV